MSKKITYTILLIVGILSFFFIKNKFSHKHSGYKLRYSLYSEQTKSSKVPLNRTFFYRANVEEDELSHAVKPGILLFFITSFIVCSVLILLKTKTEFLVRTIFFGSPTYLAIRSLRI